MEFIIVFIVIVLIAVFGVKAYKRYNEREKEETYKYNWEKEEEFLKEERLREEKERREEVEKEREKERMGRAEKEEDRERLIFAKKMGTGTLNETQRDQIPPVRMRTVEIYSRKKKVGAWVCLYCDGENFTESNTCEICGENKRRIS